MKCKRIVAINIYEEGDNPLFGDSVTTVRLEDEGGGEFLILSQISNDNHNEIRLDFDDITIINQTVRELKDQRPGSTDDLEDMPAERTA